MHNDTYHRYYLANQILHIIVWERADGCDGANEPLGERVFTLNALHDVPHSRAHVGQEDMAPGVGCHRTITLINGTI